MSHNSHYDLPLDDIYNEIMEHMKSNGDYDQMRVNLKEPIENSSEYHRIVEIFQKECEKWCSNDVDLTKSRNYLREKLRMRFESYSLSRQELSSLIRQVLKEKNKEIKQNYFDKAKSYLERFLPQHFTPPPLPDKTEPELESEPEPELETKAEPNIKPQTKPDSEAKLELERESKPEPKIEIEQYDDQVDLNNEDMEIDSSPSPEKEVNLDDIPIPPMKEGGDDDELEKMTFSSISSIGTDQLSDFENSIKLSDDEADIVGVPKNTKVPVKRIQDITKMDEIQAFNVDCKRDTRPKEPGETSEFQALNAECRSEGTEQNEPVEANESDGGCSEGTASGRRASRTRKSNPRYSNELYKLYKI